jgi:hypothetical protein
MYEEKHNYKITKLLANNRLVVFILSFKAFRGVMVNVSDKWKTIQNKACGQQQRHIKA